jgi:hypothetical protein
VGQDAIGCQKLIALSFCAQDRRWLVTSSSLTLKVSSSRASLN